MQATLQAYIDTRCVTGPTQRITVAEFVKHYRIFAKQHIKRGFIVAELCYGGYRVVIDDYDHRAHIIGLCVRGHWSDKGGRLTLETATHEQA